MITEPGPTYTPGPTTHTIEGGYGVIVRTNDSVAVGDRVTLAVGNGDEFPAEVIGHDQDGWPVVWPDTWGYLPASAATVAARAATLDPDGRDATLLADATLPQAEGAYQRARRAARDAGRDLAPASIGFWAATRRLGWDHPHAVGAALACHDAAVAGITVDLITSEDRAHLTRAWFVLTEGRR